MIFNWIWYLEISDICRNFPLLLFSQCIGSVCRECFFRSPGRFQFEWSQGIISALCLWKFRAASLFPQLVPFLLLHSLLVAYNDVIATIFRWRSLYVCRLRPPLRSHWICLIYLFGFWFPFDLFAQSFAALCRKASFVNRLHYRRSLSNGLMNSLSGLTILPHPFKGPILFAFTSKTLKCNGQGYFTMECDCRLIMRRQKPDRNPKLIPQKLGYKSGNPPQNRLKSGMKDTVRHFKNLCAKAQRQLATIINGVVREGRYVISTNYWNTLLNQGDYIYLTWYHM